jgi:hypothetical protein
MKYDETTETHLWLEYADYKDMMGYDNKNII